MAETLVGGGITHAVGWALVDFAWQGALAAAVIAIVLLALRNAPTQIRYVVACGGLFVMAALPAVSAVQHLHHSDGGAGSATMRGATAHATPGLSTMFVEASDRFAPASPDGDAAPPQSIDVEAWFPFIVGFWLLGVSGLSVRLIAGWIAIDRVRRVGLNPAPECLHIHVGTLATRVGLDRPVRIFESVLIEIPMLIGWLRPVILLPTSALTGLSPAQLEAVIAHEIAHITRHDYLVNLLQTIAETLLFYHPGIWWISRRVRIEREFCCDDAAVELCGDRMVYVRALAILEERRTRTPSFGMAATGGALLARIRRVLGVPLNENRASMWVVVLLLCVAVLPLTGVMSAGEAASAVSLVAQDSSGTGGSIRGQVTDDRTGRPLAAVAVGISQAGQLTRVTTDVLGRYEVHGLKPGEYYVVAEADSYVSVVYGQRSSSEAGIGVQLRPGEVAADIDVRLQPAATVNGRVFGVSGDGLAGVEIEVLAERYGPGGRARVPVAFAQTQQAGVFQVSQLAAGEYYIRAYTPTGSRPSQRSGGEVYASTYFPRTTNLDEAQPIVLSAGQHLFGIDVALATVRTFSVAGRLVDKTVDSFDRARVFLDPAHAAVVVRHAVAVSSTGRFQIPGVSPGDYVLRVIAPGLRWLTPFRQITVVDDDVSGVEVIARPGARVEGRILPVGLRRLPFDPRILRVETVARVEYPNGKVGSLIGAGLTTFQPDGTFAFDNVAGPVAFHVSELPAGWGVSAVRLDGVDITDNVTDFGEGVRRGIEILLTDQRTELIGRVADRNGRGVSNYTVVVFPEDRDRWRWPSRFVRAARPGHDGAYRIEGLPAANYMAIALDSIPQNAWSNADVLERLSSLAMPFRISDGEQRVFNLRLSSYPN